MGRCCRGVTRYLALVAAVVPGTLAPLGSSGSRCWWLGRPGGKVGCSAGPKEMVHVTELGGLLCLCSGRGSKAKLGGARVGGWAYGVEGGSDRGLWVTMVQNGGELARLLVPP